MLIPFARQSKNSPAAQGYSGERLLNWFLRPSDGLSGGVMVSRGGHVLKADGLGHAYAAVDHNGVLYTAQGGELWRYDGTATSIGPIPAGPTIMCSSGSELAIVVGGAYYLYDGATLASYSTGAVTNAVGVAYQDGYFIVAGSSAGRGDAITISGLDDGKTFNALDFAFAESAADSLVGIVADHGEVWLFGAKTVELWYDSGAQDFPFQRNPGAIIERGCLSGQTIAKEDNAVFWIGPDHSVYRGAGGSPEVITTREIEEVLKAATIDGAFTFTDRGHKFYGIRCNGKPTVCYDLTTGLWAERSSGISYGEWDCRAKAEVGGVEYFATASGRIVIQSDTVYTDAGDQFLSEAVSVPAEQNGNLFSVTKIHLNIAMGGSDPSITPKIVLQTSKDGREWGVEKWRDLGIIGNFFKRVTWHGLGAFRRFQVRIRCTDPVQRDVYGVAYE